MRWSKWRKAHAVAAVVGRDRRNQPEVGLDQTAPGGGVAA
jgi:hypothetical protein